MPATTTRLALLASALLLLGSTVRAQSFALSTTKSPQVPTDSENLDLGDVDLDGDFDCAIANGGDHGPKQNQLWIGLGGLQPGAPGVLVDETALRLPTVLDPCRDVEFVDVEGDGDPDLYVARDATFASVGAAWWINQGGAQGGALGFYQDDTLARWVGLGAPGSSIAPSLVLPGGG